MANRDVILTHVCLVKLRSRVRTQDLIIGPDPDGEYRLDMKNIAFFGTDKEGNAYQLDEYGTPFAVESAYFDEENILLAGPDFETVRARLDACIQKRLIWIEERPAAFQRPAEFLCVGIR